MHSAAALIGSRIARAELQASLPDQTRTSTSLRISITGRSPHWKGVSRPENRRADPARYAFSEDFPPMPMPYATRTLADASSSLREAKGECVVLIGAGCSLSAGIPLASALVARIAQDYPSVYQRARAASPDAPPGYNQVMEEMPPNQRQTLLNGYIDQARINWAHLALAQLFLNGCIDRVLTVNFDPLLVKACALVNFFPAIYDLASTERIKKHRIAPRSLFYLNGQHTGFVTLNAADELQAHRDKLRTIVQETGVRRLWLVVGYSGEADPLLDVLAEQDCFEGDLYWLGHAQEPSARLRASGLFNKGRHAFYVGGQDADACLTELAQQASCFPPALLVKPFAHLEMMIAPIDFETGGDAARIIEKDLRDRLREGTEREEALNAGVALPEMWLLSGQYQQLLDWFDTLQTPDDMARDLASWAAFTQGRTAADRACALANLDPIGARALWQQARKCYERALAIEPHMDDATDSLALTLLDLARLERRDNDELFRQLLTRAMDLLTKQSAINERRKHEVAYNLACLHALQGDTASALEQLDVARQANSLPPTEHWVADPDLASLRDAPAFIAWRQTHFPVLPAAESGVASPVSPPTPAGASHCPSESPASPPA
jgi:tetratricopeptide (TPR) repeat protein